MYPNTNLQPGQTGPEVKKLQDFLVSQGIMTPEQVATGPGIYGPQTKAAVAKWQQQNGVDNSTGVGFWGPRSIAKASSAGASSSGTPSSTPSASIVNGKIDKATLDKINSEVLGETKNDPIMSQYMNAGNTADSLLNAYLTGDFSQTKNQYGQPFTVEEQQKALKQAEEMDKAFYDQQKAKETADTEAALAQKQADYQDYLLSSGEKFQQDKSTLDQNAANQGVLFSGARSQKEKALQTAYERDQASRLGSYGRDIASTAQDYQYKYGNDAANSLSKYYNAGANTYNAGVATGGVGSSGLSNVYNPSASNYAGTRIGERAGTAQKKAAGLLANRGNKLLATSYSNQL